MAEEESLVASFTTMRLSMYRVMRLFLKVEELPVYRSTWENLSPELLQLTLQRLTIMHYLKCREICSSWREVVDYHARASKGMCPPKPQLPFVLTLSADNPPTGNLLSLTQLRAFHMSTQNWEGPLTHVNIQSVHGWLMFQRFYKLVKDYYSYATFSFFNPVSRASFNFPHLPFPGTWTSFRFMRIKFASAPYSPEFLVAVLISGSHSDRQKQLLAFCRVNDLSWTFIETVETFRDIALHDDKLYAITMRKTDCVFFLSLKDPKAIATNRLIIVDPKPLQRRSRFRVRDGIRHDTDYAIPTLAVDSTSGELLLVFHLCKRAWMDRRKYSYWTKEFRVYRLDLSGPRWSKIKNLGDRFLFYDCSSIRVISARGLVGAKEFNGGNCIFFAHANTLHVDPFQNHDVGVFFMRDKSIERCSSYSASPAAGRDIWFSPNLW